MQYTSVFTLSAAGVSTAPQSQRIKCAAGVIHQIDIVFPAGSIFLTYCRLLIGGHPIAPSTDHMYYQGDDEQVSFKEHIELIKDSNDITIEGWNEDELFDHNVYVRIYVLHQKHLFPTGFAEGIVAALGSILRPRFMQVGNR